MCYVENEQLFSFLSGYQYGQPEQSTEGSFRRHEDISLNSSKAEKQREQASSSGGTSKELLAVFISEESLWELPAR